jgi:hypothetical protein
VSKVRQVWPGFHTRPREDAERLEGKAAAWLPHSKNAGRREGKAEAWLPHSKAAERPEGVPSQERGHESNH